MELSSSLELDPSGTLIELYSLNVEEETFSEVSS
jgi:hypothetical protein